MLLIETGLTLLAVALAFLWPTLGTRWFERTEAVFSRLARKRGLAVIAVGVAALAIRAAVLPIEPVPEPIVHDEFGYLLAADTFAHGRLTNRTPPMAEHFETFSILMKPTYQCFAQPGQGMMLALGKVFFGHPFWGVWLSVGLMCAAITWMLQGWLSPEWAFLGGALAILRYGVFGYWADSYWGGTVGAVGGALVLGALPRIKLSQRVRDAVLMGTGLAILANTRPYEGFIFSLPVAVVFVFWLLKSDSPSFRITFPRVVVPLSLILALTATGMGYYFWRVTGSAVRMPYQIERQTYGVAPYMLWQHIRPEPVYNNVMMRKMYVQEELKGYQAFRSFPGLLLKILFGWSFFFGVALSVPFILLILALPPDISLRDVANDTSVLLVVLAVSTLGWLGETFYNPHYSAPVTGVILALVLLALRQIRAWSPSGKFFTRTLPIVCLSSLALRAAADPLHIPMREFNTFSWYQRGPADFGRSATENYLNSTAGKKLVFVRYSPEHEPFAEWVYNEADIEHAPIVWARELTAHQNRQLISYFKERQSFLLEADEAPPKLSPWPPM
jgi:hypothetical protein